MDAALLPPIPTHTEPSQTGPPDPQWRTGFDVSKRLVVADFLFRKLLGMWFSSAFYSRFLTCPPVPFRYSVVLAVYSGCSEAALRLRATQFEGEAFSKAMNARQYVQDNANRITEAQLQMGLAVLTPQRNSAVAVITQTQVTASQSSTPNGPNPRFDASAAISSSNPHDCSHRKTGSRGPQRTGSTQPRLDHFSCNDHDTHLVNSMNSATTFATSTTATANQAGAMMTLEMRNSQKRQQQHALLNRLKLQAILNIQQQQQVIANIEQQLHVLDSQKLKGAMVGNFMGVGVVQPNAQQQPVTSSSQSHQALHRSPLSIRTNTKPSRKALPSSDIRQKLISFRRKYEDAFNRLTPLLSVYVNTLSEEKRDAVRNQLLRVNAILDYAGQCTVPEVLTSGIIDQHAALADKLVSYLISKLRQGSQGPSAVNNNHGKTACTRSTVDANLRNQKKSQFRDSSQELNQLRIQTNLRTQAQQESESRAFGQQDLSKRPIPSRNGAVVSITPNFQFSARSERALSFPELQKKLPVSCRSGTHTGVAKPTNSESRVSTAATKAKILSTNQIRAERILKRIELTSKNVMKSLQISLEKKETANKEIVRDTLLALQRMVKTKKMRDQLIRLPFPPRRKKDKQRDQ